MDLANFRHFDYKLFFGLDDANIVYPLIYAAQDVGIKTLGFQHGVYARRHEAYVMQGIKKYRWYDNVLVWGEYWKSNVLKNSRLYSSTYHIVSSNKHDYDYKYLPKKGKNKVILIPYEFLSDSIKVGEYIKKFIEAGFKILFKPRLDESPQSQLKAYYLDEFEEKVEIVNDLTPETMAEIDVIAGGPPCQGFSMANRKRIEEDERNLLFLEFVRAVKAFQPKCFLIENVMGMNVERVAIKSKERNVIDSLTEYFHDLEYHISFKSFKSEEHGVPQMRRRVIVIGTRLLFSLDSDTESSVSTAK